MRIMQKPKKDNFYKKWEACEAYAAALKIDNMGKNQQIILLKAGLIAMTLMFAGALAHGWLW